MINPQWLHTFAMLVDRGSFTRTAEALNITQALVSQHINRLDIVHYCCATQDWPMNMKSTW